MWLRQKNWNMNVHLLLKGALDSLSTCLSNARTVLSSPWAPSPSNRGQCLQVKVLFKALLLVLSQLILTIFQKSESVSRLVVSWLCNPMAIASQTPLCPWNSPGKNTGVGSHSLLQGILNPGIEPGSPALQADSLPSESPILTTLQPYYLSSINIYWASTMGPIHRNGQTRFTKYTNQQIQWQTMLNTLKEESGWCDGGQLGGGGAEDTLDNHGWAELLEDEKKWDTRKARKSSKLSQQQVQGPRSWNKCEGRNGRPMWVERKGCRIGVRLRMESGGKGMESWGLHLWGEGGHLDLLD